MKEQFEHISALFKVCGLGDIVGEIEMVSGGLMHKMYKVRTISEAYAVKCLNPEIMKRPDALDNYERAEALERLLELNIVPIIPAISFGKKKMLEQDGYYYYVFRWQEGSITDWNNISFEQCYKAGEILAEIHRIDSHNAESVDPEISSIDFDNYIKKAEIINSNIKDLLKDNLSLLEEAQNKLNAARSSLPSMSAIDDPDMDPKNIMWHDGKPYVIDLECLQRGNPISSCLNLALQWCGTVNGIFSKENLEAFFAGYLSLYDNGFRSYDEIFGIAYTWVEWLEYNIRRALGIDSSDSEEKKLGEEEVKSTIGRIRYLHEIERDIQAVLENLPAANSNKFKTHDDRLCYVDLVFEGPLSEIPSFELPAGFRFVNYSPGNKKDWIDIELSSEEILSSEYGEECWERYYKSREGELPGRMFFIENDFGEKIATATALYDIHGNMKEGEGQLHWVAIKKEYQGKGLSKPLITFVLNVMKSLGYSTVKIHTQTNTWLACKVYYDLGFRPEKERIDLAGKW